MNKHQAIPKKLQPLEPADLVYIRVLAAEHSAELEQRCTHYRHRANSRRVVLAICIFFACCISYSSLLAKPLYDEIKTTSEAGNQHICNLIRLNLEKI